MAEIVPTGRPNVRRERHIFGRLRANNGRILTKSVHQHRPTLGQFWPTPGEYLPTWIGVGIGPDLGQTSPMAAWVRSPSLSRLCRHRATPNSVEVGRHLAGVRRMWCLSATRFGLRCRPQAPQGGTVGVLALFAVTMQSTMQGQGGMRRLACWSCCHLHCAGSRPELTRSCSGRFSSRGCLHKHRASELRAVSRGRRSPTNGACPARTQLRLARCLPIFEHTRRPNYSCARGVVRRSGPI